VTALRVMAGISGGVDSAVAALLLQRAGYQVDGLFMQNWNDDDAQGRASVAGGRMPGATGKGECRSDDDRRDAVAVCGRLGIPFHARNFAAQYWRDVFEHFLAEYAAGRTPNPDVLCNREIKFRTFLDEARALGAERIATGHYARAERRDGVWRLLRGRDGGKDQSYFLHALGQDALGATLFPVGELPKAEVRRLAREAALPVHAKKDSTGICFVGERDFRAFLARYLPLQPGEIRSVDGERLGRHDGVFFYTLGQREGLNLGGVRGRPPAPWFVVAKDVAANVLIVDQGHDSRYLQSTRLRGSGSTFVAGAPPGSVFECSAKTRYRQEDERCRVQVGAAGVVEVEFERPQRAVTPGQSVVFYREDECLGGAVIDATDAPLEKGLRHAA
jgi:tRNA-uridine 2-sulfurtransferase